MKTSIQPVITYAGQRFVDEPVRVSPKPVSEIEASLARAFERELPRSLVVGYDRVRLRWMKPDGHGGLVARG